MHPLIQLGVLVLLVLLNGVFALSELALISSRRAVLALMERRGDRGAAKARALADEPQRFLPTVQVGITLISILIGAFGGAQLAAVVAVPFRAVAVLRPYADTAAVVVTVLGITVMTMVFGELVPKQLALRAPERLAVVVAGPLAALARIVTPLVWLLSALSSAVLRLLGAGAADRRAVSEEELRAMLAEGAESGVLEMEEREIIERVMRLADKPVRAIMTPRTEIAWIDRTAPRAQIVAALRATTHSRFVVCDRSIDNVVGIVQAKDILDRILDGKDFSLAAAIRQPIAVPDGVSALDAMDRLKADPLGIAIVLDEYGSFEGLVTAADVLEAMVGDVDEPQPEMALSSEPQSSYEFDGMTPVDEVKARLDLPDLPAEGSYHTLAGLMLALLKRLPKRGDAILFAGWRLEVLSMDGRRVERMRVAREAIAE